MTKVITILASCVLGSMLCLADEFPSPSERQEPILKGREPSNPFQGKIDLAMKKVNAFSAETTALVEERIEQSASQITSNLNVRLTLFFGKDSDSNRAFVNGKLRRPGDSLMSAIPNTTGISGLHLETVARDGIGISWKSESGKVKRLTIKSENIKEERDP